MSPSFTIPNDMYALVYEAPNVMMMRKQEVPTPKSDEVLIRVEIAGICGSELSGFLGHNSLRKPPLVMGHEFSGVIVQLGSAVEHVQLGDRVTVNPLVSCHRCKDCLSGMANLCSARSLIGAGRPGAYAQYVIVPERNLHRIPDSLSFEQASFVEPFACAVRVCRLAAMNPSSRLFIAGAGPIGLFVLQTAKVYGSSQITVMDINPERLAIAHELGAQVVKNEDELEACKPSRGYDVTVDAVGMDVTRQTCMRVTKPGGRVIFSGLHVADSTIPVNLAIRNELSLYGSFGYTPSDFEIALKWIVEDKVNLMPWTMIRPLAEGQACFEKLLSQPGKVAKILLSCQ